MIRLSANYSKKVPGAAQYSSEQASASVEIEVAEADGPQVQAKLADLWHTLRQAVEQQLSGGMLATRQTATADNAHHGNNGNGHQPGRNGQASQKAAISEKQLKFVKGLIGELKPMGVDFAFTEGLCNRLFGRKLDHLDRAQASTIIGHLNEIKAGKLTVQQALAA